MKCVKYARSVHGDNMHPNTVTIKSHKPDNSIIHHIGDLNLTNMSSWKRSKEGDPSLHHAILRETNILSSNVQILTAILNKLTHSLLLVPYNLIMLHIHVTIVLGGHFAD